MAENTSTVVFRAVTEQYTKKVRGITSETNKLNSAVKDANSRLRNSKGQFASAGAGAKGAAGGVNLLGGAFKAALGPIAAALGAVTSITAAFKTLAAQDFAEAKVESLGVNADQLVGRLQSVSAELNGAASVAELTAASYDVASAGFNNAADAADVLKAASLGATGGFSDINTVGNATTSVLNAYGMEASKATEIVDKFIQTQNDGKIVVAEYAQNIGKVASAAAGLGIDLDEVNAVIAQSTASGVQADVAFTGLKGALARLASGEAAKALKDVGINIDAATLANDGLLGTFKKLDAAGLDTGQIFKALGTEAAPALLPVLNNLEKFEELLNNQKKSAGAAAKAQEKATDTIYGAWKRVTTAVENIFADQEGLGLVIKEVLNGIAEAFKRIGIAVKIGSAPFNLLMKVIGFVSNGMKELKAAFVSAFKESEGAKKLQQIFTALQGVLGKVVGFFRGQFNAAFQVALKIAGELGKLLGEGLYQSLNLIIGAIVEIGKWIPGLRDKALALEAGWNEVKTEVEGTATGVKKIEENTNAAAAAKERALNAQREALELATREKDQIQAQEAAYQNSINVTNARLNAEKAINDLQHQQLEIAYDQAKTVQGRFQIAKQIFNNEVQSARIQYEQSLNQIEAARQSLEFKKQGALIDAQMIKARGEIAILEAKGLEAKKAAQIQANKAVQTQMQAVRMIDGQIVAQNQVAQYQKQAAEAQLRSKILTAEQSLKQKLVSEEIGMSQTKANQLVTQLGNGARGANNLNTGMGQVKNNTQQTSVMMIRVATEADRAADAINRAAQAQARLNTARANSGGGGGSPEGAAQGAFWPGGFQAFAKGGMVTGPTLGLIGEGGEPEYIIPQSKAAGFAANYLSGQRGAGAIPAFADGGFVAPSTASVNIQTGPVTQMDGTNYVTTADLGRAVQSGVSQTLDILRRDGNTRAAIGLI